MSSSTIEAAAKASTVSSVGTASNRYRLPFGVVVVGSRRFAPCWRPWAISSMTSSCGSAGRSPFASDTEAVDRSSPRRKCCQRRRGRRRGSPGRSRFLGQVGDDALGDRARSPNWRSTVSTCRRCGAVGGPDRSSCSSTSGVNVPSSPIPARHAISTTRSRRGWTTSTSCMSRSTRWQGARSRRPSRTLIGWAHWTTDRSLDRSLVGVGDRRDRSWIRCARCWISSCRTSCSPTPMKRARCGIDTAIGEALTIVKRGAGPVVGAAGRRSTRSTCRRSARAHSPTAPEQATRSQPGCSHTPGGRRTRSVPAVRATPRRHPCSRARRGS